MQRPPVLVVFGGLPGVGKTTIARELAKRLSAVFLRIDTIELGIGKSAMLSDGEAGYRVAYALAAENLRLGSTVIADSVNPLPVTRDAWLQVGQRTGASVLEVEVVCSDVAEHRRRVEERLGRSPELGGPPWAEVVLRDYRPWDRDRLVLDNAGKTAEDGIAAVRVALSRISDVNARDL